MYDNLYHVNIFQNAHIAAYGGTHMHTPPKVFIQSWINFTQLGKSKTRGYVDQEIANLYGSLLVTDATLLICSSQSSKDWGSLGLKIGISLIKC